MKSLRASRYALSVCVAAILLAGCGRSLSAPRAANAVTAGAVRMPSAQGGAFGANYSGTVKIANLHGNHHYTFTFDGTGVASFLGPSRETGTLTESCTLGCRGRGILTLRSSKHPKAVVFMKTGWEGPMRYGGRCLPYARWS